MDREEEYIKALSEIKPSWFMLSGGGNDLLDDGKGFKDLIRKFLVEDSGRKIEDYIVEDKLNERLNFVMGLYQKIFTKVTRETEFDNVKILCHGYDYVRPSQTGIILGSRMIERNIRNETTMFKIIKLLIDRFNKELRKLVEAQPNFEGRIFYIDCTGSADENDFNTNPLDDFHPSSEGFKKIANNFLAVLKNGSP